MSNTECTCGVFGSTYCNVHAAGRVYDTARKLSELPIAPSSIAPYRTNKVRYWTVLLNPTDKNLYALGIVRPGQRVSLRGSPMIHFRPAQIAISTNSRAKLSVEFRASNQCWEFGAVDTWTRKLSQKPTVFIRKLIGMDVYGPANTMSLEITNYGKFDSKVFAQIDGLTVGENGL